MKRFFFIGIIIIAILLLIILKFNISSYTKYDVWNPILSLALAPGDSCSFGPQDVTDREKEYVLFAYSTPNADSLKLSLYGMMNYAKADTVHMILLTANTTTKISLKTVVLPDSLDDDENFPFVYGRVSNENASAETLTVNVYFYAKKRDINIIK